MKLFKLSQKRVGYGNALSVDGERYLFQFNLTQGVVGF